MKPSNEPVVWVLFGAGGILAAVFGPVLIFITGIAAPLGLLLSKQTMSYGHMLAFARNPIGKAFILAVIALFLFHGIHRIYHSLHDLGVVHSKGRWTLAYGAALGLSLLTALLLLNIGF